MYLVKGKFKNGGEEYYGPFPNKERALKFSEAVDREIRPQICTIEELIVPYSVVKRIEYQQEG